MIRNTFGAIDIGSNAVRLLINYVERDSGVASVDGAESKQIFFLASEKSKQAWTSPRRGRRLNPEGVKMRDEGPDAAPVEFKKAAFIRVPIRLGEDVFTEGKIGRVKTEQLVEAMQGFGHLMRVYGVQGYRACATSAMREAENSDRVVKQLLKKSGIRVDIISGQEEAALIFEAAGAMGASDGLRDDKSYLSVDVGGGSTEVTVYSNHQRAMSESFALGTVRIISGAAKEEELERFTKWLQGVTKEYHPAAIVGSGGNINKVFKILEKKEKEPLKLNELKTLFTRLSKLSYDERVTKCGLNPYRADVIMPALEIFLTAARTCKIDEVIVPKIGLADGIIHRLYRQFK